MQLGFSKFMGYLLISSARHRERDASSEIYYLLNSILKLEDVYVKPTHISGLSLARMAADATETLVKLKDAVENDATYARYTTKIVPIDFLIGTDLDKIAARAAELTAEIPEGKTWRVSLRKRHTPLSRTDIIEQIAKEVTHITVALENPDYCLVVEILGQRAGLCLVPPGRMASYSVSRVDIEDPDQFTW